MSKVFGEKPPYRKMYIANQCKHLVWHKDKKYCSQGCWIFNEILDYPDCCGRYCSCFEKEDRHMAENNAIRPNHYCSDRKYEPKDVIRDWNLNFNLGNSVKYIARAGKKDDIVQDLKKAQQYLAFEIEFLEKQRENHANDNKILDISPDEAEKFTEFAKKHSN